MMHHIEKPPKFVKKVLKDKKNRYALAITYDEKTKKLLVIIIPKQGTSASIHLFTTIPSINSIKKRIKKELKLKEL